MDLDSFCLRFDGWKDKIQQHVDRHNGEAKKLKSIATVGAFIAGVQAQLLSSTLTLPPTLQANVCNTLSFIGLIADITGTICGAINALSLQAMGKQGTQSLNSMAQLKNDLIIVLKHQELKKGRDHRYTSVPHGESAAQAVQSLLQIGNTHGNTISFNHPHFYIMTHTTIPVIQEPDDMVERSLKIMQTLDELSSRSSGIVIPKGLLDLMRDVAKSAGHLKLKRPSGLRGNNEASSIEVDLPYLTRVPLATMGLGVMCLAVTVIIFAAAPKVAPQENQGAHVWILCTCVLVGAGSTSLPWSEWLPRIRGGTQNAQIP